MSNNIAPVIEELRRAYKELKPLFDQTFGDAYELDEKQSRYVEIPLEKRNVNMPMPVITVQARGRKKVDGWYKAGAWEDLSVDAINALVTMGGNSKVASNDEICIAAEALDKPKNEILTILVAQMVHHYAKSVKGQIVQNENGYHTREFQRYAEMVGLNAEADGSRGYAKVSPKARLTESFDKIDLDPDVFDMHRKGEQVKEFKGSKLKKWSCGCTNIRVAVYMEATCNICGKPFEYADKDKDADSVQAWLKREKGYLDNNESIWNNRAKGRKAS